MPDLFADLPAKPLKVGQANGEFLARLAMMHPAERGTVKPADFPQATPRLVRANVAFLTGTSHTKGAQ